MHSLVKGQKAKYALAVKGRDVLKNHKTRHRLFYAQVPQILRIMKKNRANKFAERWKKI